METEQSEDVVPRPEVKIQAEDVNIRHITSTSGMLSVAFIILAVVVYILTTLNAHHHPQIQNNVQHSPTLNNKKGPGDEVHNMNKNIRKQVEVWQWKEEKNFFLALQEINKNRKHPVPVILKQTVVNTWPASTLWRDKDYLIRHPSLSGLLEVDVGTKNTFLYVDEGQDMWTEGIPGLKPRQYDIRKMKLTDMFSAIYDPKDPKYYYYYGKIEDKLLDDVDPNHVLWKTKTDQARGGIFLWLSGHDVRPALHFDSDHNIFVHLNGRHKFLCDIKRFVLFPPWEWDNLYVYPRLHPSWHKSQLEFDHTDLRLFPKAVEAPAYEAILEPGDVLYVPPYWFHHVESLSPSEFSAHGPMHELFHNDFFWRSRGAAIEKKDKMGLIAMYIEGVLQGLLGNHSMAEEFLAKSLQSHWTSPMLTLVQDRVTITCPEHLEATDEVLRALDEDVEFTIKCFNSITPTIPPFTRYEAAIMQIMLSDWIELAVSEVVGASNTYYFLANCIDTSPPLDDSISSIAPNQQSADWDAWPKIYQKWA